MHRVVIVLFIVVNILSILQLRVSVQHVKAEEEYRFVYKGVVQEDMGEYIPPKIN
jgi:hypothetical protein